VLSLGASRWSFDAVKRVQQSQGQRAGLVRSIGARLPVDGAVRVAAAQRCSYQSRRLPGRFRERTFERLSNRAVPLQATAIAALDRLPPSENPILVPNSRGGRIDFRTVGPRDWKPAQTAAGINPLRSLYDLRHTYATFALRAGVPVFAVSRFMGSSVAMIDYRYGHLADDSRQMRRRDLALCVAVRLRPVATGCNHGAP
jgi:hypothetical protein